MPEDRAQAVKVIDDDTAFDRWLASYDRKISKPSSPGKANMVTLPEEEFVDRFATVF